MIATSDITESGMILETLQALLMALETVNETNLGELKQTHRHHAEDDPMMTNCNPSNCPANCVRVGLRARRRSAG